MQTVVTQSEISKLGSSILSTLLYADVFSYPLTQEEIYARCSLNAVTIEQLSRELNQLVEEKRLFSLGNFYSVQNNPGLIKKRLKSNQTAERYMGKARFISRCIGAFPYVRAVFLSGSISKGCMDRNSDIDYFIITQPGRLWVTKTLLFVVRKLIPFQFRKKYFCFNYLIDSSRMEIAEKNLFTATEIITVIPTYGGREYLDFYRANQWVRGYYPNVRSKSIEEIPSAQSGLFKKITEKILSGRWGDRLENRLMRYLSDRHQRKREFLQFTPEERVVALKTNEHIAKLHGNHQQGHILNALEAKIRQYEQQHGVNLTPAYG